MRRSKRGDKEGQGRGQGSNLRWHLPGSCEVRVDFGAGRENPAPKLENPLDLGHQLGHVADICQARTKVYRCDLCMLWGLRLWTYPIMGIDPVAPTRQPPPRPPSTCGRAPPKGLR